MKYIIWNVRGLNRPSMQFDLRNKIKLLKLDLIVLLETKVKPSSAHYVATSIMPNGWVETSNIADDCSSARIWLLWNPRVILLQTLQYTAQAVHCEVTCRNGMFEFTACYGYNNYLQRRDLWQFLIDRSKIVSKPWIVAGDFNTIRWVHEKAGGSTPRAVNLIEFNDCIQEAGLVDLPLQGPSFTWSNSSIGDSRIESRLDRVLVNAEFLHSNLFQGEILMPGISDHSPVLLSPCQQLHVKSPFRYFNYWAKMPGFFETVRAAWATDIRGTPLYRVVQKLRIVKRQLIDWSKTHSSISSRVSEATSLLTDIQSSLREDPNNSILQIEERRARIHLDHLLQAEESMYKQKSRDLAVNLGDSNTKYFYRLMRQRQGQSFISHIEDLEGNTYSDHQGIAAAFVSHFQNILAPTVVCQQPDLNHITPHAYVTDEDVLMLMRPVTIAEIEDSVKNANPHKAPGPDGFNAHFFKVCWPIIGNDVCDSIIDFFKHGSMLRQLKHTFIVLVPKSDDARSPDKFRPIALTNELYKIISRILLNRLKPIIGKIVGPMQSAFVPGRSITDNILLAQDLLHNFHLNRGTPRMCIKLDLAKAYDSVRWDFLEAALRALRFPDHIIRVIMECVTQAQFSVLVNGSSEGFFKGTRGLRQGCPLSPFLFTIVMEYFSLMMTKYADSHLIPSPFVKGAVTVSHLMFADDLMVFSKASPAAAANLKHFLENFKRFTGLGVNWSKSAIFFAHCQHEEEMAISSILNIPTAKLPIRYLGLPLSSKRLNFNDCQPILSNIQKRLAGWKAKALSYAGRVELIKSTLSSLHLYWASVYMLPQATLHALDRQVRDFFWNCWSSYYIHPIAWDTICQPLAQGGLGIRSLYGTSKAALLRQVWQILLNKSTCWNIWINARYIRGKSFWDIPKPRHASWGWRSILSLRRLAKNHIKFLIGNGHHTKFWTDPWLNGGRLKDRYGDRAIYDMGLGVDVYVHQFIRDGGWSFPIPTSNSLMEIFQLIPHEVEPWTDFDDEVVWMLEDNGRFTFKSAYNMVCNINEQHFTWPSLLWFKGCIKKHSICAWMCLKRRLKTKEFLLLRNVNCDSLCVLCDATWECDTHLMIQCPYSKEIWTALLATLNLSPIECATPLELVQSVNLQLAQGSSDTQTLGRLLVNAFIWHIWAERNGRIFRAKSHTQAMVTQRIMRTVCSRALYLGLQLPETIASHWNLPAENQCHTPYPLAVQKRGWRLSITKVGQLVVGIVWSDIMRPLCAQVEVAANYYPGLLQIMHLIPSHVHHLTIEGDTRLIRCIFAPAESDWKDRFQMRKLNSIIAGIVHVQLSPVHKTTFQFSKFLSGYSGQSTHFNTIALVTLFATFASLIGSIP